VSGYSVTLAKGRLSPAKPLHYRGSTPLLLCRFEGQADILNQILALEKKVFAKKASWTGMQHQQARVC